MKKSIFKNWSFTSLWIGIFFSTVSTYLLLITFSANTYLSTNSNLSSASIFSVNWILPILLLPLTLRITSSFDSRHLLIVSTILQASLAFILYMIEVPLYGVYIVFLLRGYLEAIEKSSRLISVKARVPKEQLHDASSLFATGMYAGIGVGSFLGASLIQIFDIFTISMICTGLYLVACIFYGIIPGAQQIEKKINIQETFATIKQYNLWTPIISLLVVVSFFQGYHNVARTAFTMGYLDLGKEFIGYLQVITTIAVVLGALFVQKYMNKYEILKVELNSSLVILLTSVALSLTLVSYNYVIAFAFYFLFIFFFEVAYTYMQNQIVVKTPDEHAANVFTVVSSLSISSLACGILVIGYAVDNIELPAFVICQLILFTMMYIYYFLVSIVSRPIKEKK